MSVLSSAFAVVVGIQGGQWAGAVGEISDERVIWDPFTMQLEVDGERASGGFFHTTGVSADLAGSVDGDELRFETEINGRTLEFTGTFEEGLLRGTCRDRKLELAFIAMREEPPEDEDLEACAGLYTADDGSAVWIRKSLHLILDDFGRGLRRILYAAETDQFVAGELFGLTDPPALRVSFERDAAGQVTGLRIEGAEGLDVRAERCPAYRAEAFEFETSDGLTLRGTLTLPEGEGPHPGVVWVHGSGRARRVGAGSWPAFFASRGFATLAVDKRGVGESDGKYELPDGGHDNHPHMARRAGDVRHAVAALRKHPSIDSEQIGLCGASQAGWVIPQASGTGEVKFAITISGGATALSYENVYSQLADELDADGSSLPFDELIERTRKHRARDPHFRDHFAKMKCAGLWLYGLKDRSNPSQLCIEEIEGVAAEHGNDFTLVSFADANHSLLQCSIGGAQESRAMGTRAPGMFQAVADWLEERGFGPR
jgi:hypothetical protein